MPILTFWGVTPSGASAKAVFAFPKGKKGAFSGAPGQIQKLSTICTAVLGLAAGKTDRRDSPMPRRPVARWAGLPTAQDPLAKPARKAPRLTCRRGGWPLECRAG